MMQTPLLSLIEAIANIVVGYGLAVVTQILVFPVFGLSVTVSDTLMIGWLFTVVSLARSYALRRLFNRLNGRGGPA